MIHYLTKHGEFLVRPGTCDHWAVREVPNTLKHMGVIAGDRVLDVGAHIGVFSVMCAKLGAAVTAVEPEPGNIEVFDRNTDSVDGILLMRAALTDDPAMLAAGRVPLFVNEKKHKGLHRLQETRGRSTVDVTVASFRETLRIVSPTVLKVDIEGAEFSCDWTSIPDTVRVIHVEMHMNVKDARKSAPKLHDTITGQGFTAVVEPKFHYLWGTHPVYKRL